MPALLKSQIPPQKTTSQPIYIDGHPGVFLLLTIYATDLKSGPSVLNPKLTSLLDRKQFDQEGEWVNQWWVEKGSFVVSGIYSM